MYKRQVERRRRWREVGLRPDGKEEEAGDFVDGLKGKREARCPPVAENLMTKIVLSTSRDIPLNKLVLSQATCAASRPV